MTISIQRIIKLGFPWQTLDPFLFCVYHHDNFPAGNGKNGPDASLAGRQIGQDFGGKDGWNMYHGDRIPGFPAHPHRGFETLTLVNEGIVDHADSAGSSGRYGGGDAQWMTAGKGVQHSEMFPLLNADQPNPMRLFQIWINLPSANKMVEPHYGMLWREQIPIAEVIDDQGKATSVQVVAGDYAGHTPPPPPPESWASDLANHVAIWVIKIPAGGTFTLPGASESVNRTLYFYQGDQCRVANTPIDPMHGVILEATDSVDIAAGDSSECCFLMLQGKPIGEPVVQYGPFVMNTEQELRQTFKDYQRDQFGGWPWPDQDVVHTEAKTRFARYADGVLEEKPL